VLTTLVKKCRQVTAGGVKRYVGGAIHQASTWLGMNGHVGSGERVRDFEQRFAPSGEFVRSPDDCSNEQVACAAVR
jgi:hypothetical protein